MALQFQCMTDPPAQDFLEAVELRHDLFLRTKDPDPNFREVLVKPYFLGHITGAPYGRPEVPLPSLWVNVPGVRTNHAFALCEIVEWAVVTEADLTVRTLREKARHDFSLHPADKMLENMDRDLRQHWRAATQHPDFDPAPFVALDRRLGELAAALRAWHDDLGKAGVR